MRKLSEPLSPREVLALRLSRTAQRRVDDLLSKHRGKGLNQSEMKEWRLFEMTEHLVRMAKLNAAAKVREPKRT